MHSKHALIVSLIAGAGALLVVFSGLLSLALLRTAEPYLGARELRDTEEVAAMVAPSFTTKIEGGSAQIVEVDASGQTLSILYTSDLNDPIADFGLFAVPQTNYAGKIYVQSIQDAEGATLIVYPLDAGTGLMGAAVINTPSNKATISPEQNRVAVITTLSSTQITAYDLPTGTVLASWTLNANERLNEGGYSRTYTGEGVRWVSNNCFDHAVWVDNVTEIRSFCIESGSSF